MKLQVKTVFGIMLLVATAVAQEAQQGANAAASKPSASASTASKKEAARIPSGPSPRPLRKHPSLLSRTNGDTPLG